LDRQRPGTGTDALRLDVVLGQGDLQRGARRDTSRGAATGNQQPADRRERGEVSAAGRGRAGLDRSDYDLRPMRQAVRVILLAGAMMSVAATIAACGTQRIDVAKSDGPLYDGAVLFSQRCSGCHTLSFAATHGSAPNIRTAQANSGPNFNQRCERPITRVLYAIENGGFSGAIMPQNIVVGQQAMEVAKFVATYAGRQAPKQVGIINCEKRSLGTLPAATGASSTSAASAAVPPTTAVASVPARTHNAGRPRVAVRTKTKSARS